MANSEMLEQAVRAKISCALINVKGNFCPLALRLAIHTSGTYDQNDPSTQAGGSNGATMRFEPEKSDIMNAGLTIMHDLLYPIKKQFDDISYADLWTLAGVQAILLTGGPEIAFRLGRTDAPDSSHCPPNGRLVNAYGDAHHLRHVYSRMGFGDREIVALSGARTIGSCHDYCLKHEGSWTRNPYKFDNEYFKNLLDLDWQPRHDNNKNDNDNNNKNGDDKHTIYHNAKTNLIMLPSDLALIHDPALKEYVEQYAADEELFVRDFAEAFALLLAKGCPTAVQPPDIAFETEPTNDETTNEKDVDDDTLFRDLAGYGAVDRMKELTNVNVNAKEQFSNRTALHKAAFYGHVAVVDYLCHEFKNDINVNAQDMDGDTALHDAARLGHVDVVKALLAAGADTSVRNKEERDAEYLAASNGKLDVVELLKKKENDMLNEENSSSSTTTTLSAPLATSAPSKREGDILFAVGCLLLAVLVAFAGEFRRFF